MDVRQQMRQIFRHFIFKRKIYMPLEFQMCIMHAKWREAKYALRKYTPPFITGSRYGMWANNGS